LVLEANQVDFVFLPRREWPHPEKARELLVEAGYPDRFSVTLDCANDWRDDEIAEC
jgi:ABC-type transport system substrate-binding protein